ncbi:MAG: class I SAM-dependent rRNA methyltransferase, partial [Chitinivibrionales bacterium]|nr:class I SAM-dependent rRNA methyltransferase [Chitinivibrionales bacterium]
MNHPNKFAAPPVIHLKAARGFRHPWIFSKMVTFPRKPLDAGTIVEIRSKTNEFIAWGTWHPGQMIALRVLSEDKEQPITEAFVRRRLERAKKLREDILDLPQQGDSYRLVHAEADGLSGIIIDKLGDVLVIEPFSAGVLSLGPMIVSALKILYPGCRIGFRPAPKVEARENVTFAPLLSTWPLPEKTFITENELRYEIDFCTGHKTGFFLDQHENRLFVSELAREATVLDLCCYTGGFALSALRGGATDVIAVDLDEKALVTAEVNAALNGFPRQGQACRFVHENAFDYLRKAHEERRTWNIVIVDPAKLAS